MTPNPEVTLKGVLDEAIIRVFGQLHLSLTLCCEIAFPSASRASLYPMLMPITNTHIPI